jgi:hypothetical protein
MQNTKNGKLTKNIIFGPYLLFVICFEFSISCFGFAKPAFAQELSLSIAPPITEIAVQPGKSFTQTFSIRNDGAPVTVIAKIFPFVPLDNEGHAELIEDPTSVSAFAGWFLVDPAPVNLGTGGSHDYYIKISPPVSTEEKDYYFTLIIETQNDNNLGVDASQSQARIGANILLTVSKDGNPQKKASIVEFSAPILIDSFTGLTYKILVGNSGYTFFKPVGKITIDQIFGSTTSLALAPLNVLVGGNRNISCIEGENIIPCKLPGKFAIGIYRANLSFTVDGTGASIEKQIYTVAFPFSIVIALAVLIFIYRIIKKYISHDK